MQLLERDQERQIVKAISLPARRLSGRSPERMSGWTQKPWPYLQDVPLEFFQDLLLYAAGDETVHAQESEHRPQRRLKIDQFADRILLRGEIDAGYEICNQAELELVCVCRFLLSRET